MFGIFRFKTTFRNMRNKNYAGDIGKILRSVGKTIICHYHSGGATIHHFSGSNLLNSGYTNRFGIIFALNGIFFRAFLCDNINTIVATGFCDFYIVKTVSQQVCGNGVFVIISGHKTPFYISKTEKSTKTLTALQHPVIFEPLPGANTAEKRWTMWRTRNLKMN